MYTHTYIYTHIYVCVCIFLCVCVYTGYSHSRLGYIPEDFAVLKHSEIIDHFGNLEST